MACDCQRARIAELEVALARERDARQKGDDARHAAMGMEMHIAELEARLAKAIRIIHWLGDCECGHVSTGTACVSLYDAIDMLHELEGSK